MKEELLIINYYDFRFIIPPIAILFLVKSVPYIGQDELEKLLLFKIKLFAIITIIPLL